MADVVLVHGIGQEQVSADTLEAAWIPSIAGGLRVARFPLLADAIWRGSGVGVIDSRMAYYGDLFRKAGVQGDDLRFESDEEAAFAEALALEWLMRAAERASSERDRADAAFQLDAVLGARPENAQGLRAQARPAMQALMRLRWFAPHGLAFAEKFVLTSLQHVSRYFCDEKIRRAAIDRVLTHLTKDTKAVIAHSLGSIVAFEALHCSDHPLPIFVTMGSPLGLETVIYQRLRPFPPTLPLIVERWINVADVDDLVAAEIDLSAKIPAQNGKGSHTYTVDNGARAHKAEHYLVKREVAEPLGQTLVECLNIDSV